MLSSLVLLSAFLAQDPSLSALDPAPIAVPGSDLRVQVTGLVLDPDGSPVAGAEVVASTGARTLTDGAGRYVLRDRAALAVDSLEVSVRHLAGHASVRVELSAGGKARARPLVLARGGACEATWLPEYGEPNGCNHTVHVLREHDDGRGPALFAGGSFFTAGGAHAFAIARWDGDTWTELGGGLSGEVHALAVYDEGFRPWLYAGGRLFGALEGPATSGILRWDGEQWKPLDGGVQGEVLAMTAFDDGSGSVLVVGGEFQEASGVSANRIATWDGVGWNPLGDGFDGAVQALAVFDDGSGPALVAGGAFGSSGGVPVGNLARWNGISWEPLGGAANATVLALAVHDDGSGPALYAAGNFTSIGGIATSRIARWEGTTWSSVGGGLQLGGATALAVHDDGSGPALCVGGRFGLAGGQPAAGLARWDGTSWSALGSGTTSFGTPEALASFDGELYAGGDFLELDARRVNRIAAWNGAAWHRLDHGLEEPTAALASFDDGTGERLAAGSLTWNGEGWVPYGDGLTGVVHDLLPFDDGSGPALYAGGTHRLPGQLSGPRGFTRWNGTTWEAFGDPWTQTSVAYALAMFDDGAGEKLYAYDHSRSLVRVWDGVQWTSIPGPGGLVDVLLAFDDGSGPALYAGGTYQEFDPRILLSRWNGATWTPVETGLPPALTRAFDLCVHDDGSGPALFAVVQRVDQKGFVVRWRDGAWSTVGPRVDGVAGALASFEDGNGAQLYVGGAFESIGGVAMRNVARWNGLDWAPLEGGVDGSVWSLLATPDALVVGGDFRRASGSSDGFVARWGCDREAPILHCPTAVSVVEGFGSGPGAVVHFAASAEDDKDDAPLVEAEPPSGSVFPRGTTTVTVTATDAAGNSSTCTFPVTVERKVKAAR